MKHYGWFIGVFEMIGQNPVIEDNRGRFTEVYPIKSHPAIFPNGIQQVSQSVSNYGVLRGMHWQVGMQKAFNVLRGSVRLVLADLRRNSPTYGQYSIDTIYPNENILFVPSGVAIGFFVETHTAHVQYFHSCRYDPSLAFTLAWNDPTVNIDWGFNDLTPTLSDKDAHEGLSLVQWENTFESTLPEAQLTDHPLVL